MSEISSGRSSTKPDYPLRWILRICGIQPWKGAIDIDWSSDRRRRVGLETVLHTLLSASLQSVDSRRLLARLDVGLTERFFCMGVLPVDMGFLLSRRSPWVIETMKKLGVAHHAGYSVAEKAPYGPLPILAKNTG